MTVTITFTEKQQAAFDKRITGAATAESLAETIVIEQAQTWADSDQRELRATLAQNEDLMRVGKAVSLAPPNKQAAAIAAAEAALLSPPR